MPHSMCRIVIAMLAVHMSIGAWHRRVAAQAVLWVGRLGTDTITVEAAERRGARIDGILLSRAVGLTMQRYEADLDAAGQVRALRVWPLRTATGPVPEGAPPSLTIHLEPDSIRVTRIVGDSIARSSIPAVAGAVPLLDRFLSPPIALLDLAVTRAARQGGSAALYYVGAGVETVTLTPTGPATWAFPYTLAQQYSMLEGARLYVRMDTAGMFALDARETTFKLVTTRDRTGDRARIAEAILAMAEEFGRRGWGTAGLNALSPPQSATGRVAGVEIEVHYGQPSRRGRRIFPDVVPPGRIWRAGANAATKVTFSADVLVAGCSVAAGSYSVWVVPGGPQDTLVLNGVANTWGVMHDPARDVLRVPMRRTAPEQRAEALTYAIQDGALHLLWDDRRMSVDVQAATEPPIRCR